MKKIAKWALGILLTPIVIFVLLTVALYLPPVQNWAVDTVAAYASEETGMDITVEEVRLVFPLDLGVNGVRVLKQNDSLPQRKDTIADISRLVADVQLMPLFDGDVQIDRFDIYDMKVNTTDFIAAARVKGILGLLSIESHGIDLTAETVRLNKAVVHDANLDVALADSVPEDTTASETRWKIDLDDLAIERTSVMLHMPGDTMQVAARLGKAAVKKGYFDLYKGLYQIASLDIADGAVNYDNVYQPRLQGLDANHIALSNINVGIDSLRFCAPDLKVNIRQCAMREKSGIALDSMRMAVVMDSAKVFVDGWMKTPYSRLVAVADMDLNTFDEQNPGKVRADLDASLGKQDLLFSMGAMPKAFQAQWPAKPLSVRFRGGGNMKHVDISALYAQLPTAFLVTGSGYADNPTNVDKLKAKLHLDAHTYDLSFVKTMLDRDMQKMIGLPQMHAIADVVADGHNYDVDFRLREGTGQVTGSGKVNTDAMSYTAQLDARGMQLQHFVKGMGLGGFTGSASVSGKGFDVFSPRTNIKAQARVANFKYDKWNLNNMNLDALLSGGKAQATLVSHNDLIDGTIGLDALMSQNPLKATLTTDLNNADLFALKMVDAPFSVAACAHVDMVTDKDEYIMVQGLLSDITIRDSANVYRPDDMVLDLLTRKDTTHVVADCGDFHLNADTHGGYKYLMRLGDKITKELDRQMSERIIDENALRAVLPTGHVYLSAGHDNPVWRSVEKLGYSFANVYMDFTCSPEGGINGDMRLDTLVAQGIQLDRMDFRVQSDEKQMTYKAELENGKDNPQYCFRARLSGDVLPNGTTARLKIDDAKGRKGVDVGLSAMMEQEGIRVRFNEQDQVLGYKAFVPNDGNYIFLAKDMRVSADMRLRAADGTGIQIYTDDENLEAMQDVTVSLHQFELAEIMAVVPYTPDVSGVMDGDFHVMITPENLSVSSSVDFRNLTYEKWPMGNISSEFVYVPKGDGSHYIDGILIKEGMEVGTLVGSYNPEGEGTLDADVDLKDFPLDIANGFVPDQIIGLQGVGNGCVKIAGPLTKPQVDGEIKLHNASLISVPYGVSMKFADEPVVIQGSRLLLDNFKMYANNDQPLVTRGKIDFADLDHIFVDLKMDAQNYKIVDAKETRRSEAYGQGYVNFHATMNGELDRLQVKGNVEVLPSTNLYYILRDSPITTDNRLKELVMFTDLGADEAVTVAKPQVDGLDVTMNVSVKNGAHITCWLNGSHTNYLDVIGGGDLKMLYRGGDISVTGRYTIDEGEMKYSLPVIPLKTFKIADGSYIEFVGDMMNPRLNISAAEENKTSVNIDGQNQTVLFNCGVKISKTLQDMGLEFTIDAPENQTVSDELKTKSLEERGKLAVTMLTTGMYLTENNTGSFTMNSALTSFLQQEINNIAGSALRTLDLSVGLENTLDASGEMHTDYSFKFAKRFLDNRLSVSIGGKISTGTYNADQNNTFFDNVEMQYRLSESSNQYLQAFYKRAVYDYLEGYVGEYGAGYIWKRKLQRLSDIFNFRGKDNVIVTGKDNVILASPDSLKTKNDGK